MAASFHHEQISYQLRLSLLYFSGLIGNIWKKSSLKRNEIRVLEIGGGYGALAVCAEAIFLSSSLTPLSTFLSSLAFSGTYLTLNTTGFANLCRERPCTLTGFRLVPAQMADQITERFDLVINTLSMCEMGTTQVEEYARLIRDVWLVDGGFFFEQNSDNRPVGFNNPELILQNFLERKVAINWNRSRLLHGTPSVWQRVGANPGITLNADVPALRQIRLSG